MRTINGLLMNKMLSTAAKLPLSASRVLLLGSAVFIFLSDSQAIDARKCYWCGPLAEQVHRSQRAPPCDAAENSTADCDPGYQYCAVVATAPPFKESRYCVKLYQDECYSTYCNSSKTWRMTCPCRGDLCNGPNSEREKKAFNNLTKLTETANYVRIKRARKSLSKFINNNNNEMDNMIKETINITSSEAIKDIKMDLSDAMSPFQSTIEDIPKLMSTVQVKITDTQIIDENGNLIDVILEPSEEVKEITETSEMSSVIERLVEISTTLGELKLSTDMNSPIIKEMSEETSTVVSMVGINKLPTAEALQLNTNPLENNQETLTENTVTHMVTESHKFDNNNKEITSNTLELNTESKLTDTQGMSSATENTIDIDTTQGIAVSTHATVAEIYNHMTTSVIVSEKISNAEALQQDTNPVENSQKSLSENTLMYMVTKSHKINENNEMLYSSPELNMETKVTDMEKISSAVDKPVDTDTTLGEPVSIFEEMKLSTNDSFEEIPRLMSTLRTVLITDNLPTAEALRHDTKHIENNNELLTENTLMSVNNNELLTENTLMSMATESQKVDENNEKTSSAPELNTEAKVTNMKLINGIMEKTINTDTTLSEAVSTYEKTKTTSLNSAVDVKTTKQMTTVKNVAITEKLPTAEALQQNTSLTEKPKELTTTENTMTTINVINTVMTTVSTSTKNNNGIALQNQLTTLITGIILNQYL